MRRTITCIAKIGEEPSHASLTPSHALNANAASFKPSGNGGSGVIQQPTAAPSHASLTPRHALNVNAASFNPSGNGGSVLAMLGPNHHQTHKYSQELKEQERFPTEIEQAYEHVLRKDDVGPIQRGRRWDDPIEYPPVSHCKFQLKCLDPLNHRRRFSYEKQVNKAELFFHRWFVESDASRLGVFMEAAICCHAIHKEACFHCKHRKALRWKGGSADAWKDLVCIHCQAIYEIKTKKSMEEVRQSFEFNQIQGGSFHAACRLENSRPSSKMKRFLVLLPRNATSKKGQMVHPVQVEEISKILPAACESSTFHEKRSSKPVQSVVSVKNRIASLHRNNRSRHWFDLPQAASARPLQEIAKNVFLERFSDEEYERLKCKYFKTPSIPQPEESNNSGGVLVDEPDEETAMELLNNQFAELDTPDNWEEMDSESED